MAISQVRTIHSPGAKLAFGLLYNLRCPFRWSFVILLQGVCFPSKFSAPALALVFVPPEIIITKHFAVP